MLETEAIALVTRPFPGKCPPNGFNFPYRRRELTVSNRCRQTLTVEALGWTEFSLCCVTLIATLIWMRSGLGKKKLTRDSRTFV